jgi:hypothetical protein
VIWKIIEHEDNLGDYDPTGREGSSQRIDFSSAYRFEPSDPSTDHYQIDVVSRGWGYSLDGSYRSQNWNATYRFQNGSYRLMKLTQFHEAATAKAKPRN